MSALGDVAGGALAGQLWKVSTLVLAAVLLVVVGCAGTGLWLIAAARDSALQELTAERASNAELHASLALQNSSLEMMAAATKAASERRDLAERLTSTAIKSAADRVAAAKSSTAIGCDAVLREAWSDK
ncbi:hypothetical protein GTP38_23380 [Duganella sp. FT94W]|uniref:Chemotaxis protein n=1 Tax=Duganella lactea TaxID=2692173 RepID=A0ABW9VCB5_9BURK|nr:hypothetical protein [Duganella lactea]MYM37273.1 hypothetical protein [Duganella lactea]